MGGYATGMVSLNVGDVLNIYVGGTGLSTTTGVAAGGWNGGGTGCASSSSEPGNGGGGATDIRVNGTSLNDRIIVAGGGGGGGEDNGDICGHGGGEVGASYPEYDAIQSAAGGGGDFGIGGSTINGDGGGGGGGWYGGGTLSSTTAGTDTQGGGGGSGYVFTSTSFKPAGYAPNTRFYLTTTSLIAGNLTMPNPVGGTEVGHQSNGHARITLQQ